MPEAGRIVAVGGHLHGGAQVDPSASRAAGTARWSATCPPTRPPATRSTRVRPLLHEPDPKSISWWQSATGWPIRKGERLKVTAAYDNTRPHTRVMGIEHVYVAPPLDAGRADAAAPPRRADAQSLGAEFADRAHDAARRSRSRSPALDARRHRARDHHRRGHAGARSRARVASVFVRDFTFGPQQLTVRRGATVRWHFADDVKHDVTLADGPRGFGSPWLRTAAATRTRFTEPGTYLLIAPCTPRTCRRWSTVKRARPRRRGADRPRR